MSLPLFLLVLRKRAGFTLALYACVLVGAAAALLLTPARYEAVALASIDPNTHDPVSGLGPTPGSLLILQGNLATLAKSQNVARAVAKRLALDEDPDIKAQAAARKAPDVAQFAAEQLLDKLEARFLAGSNVLNLAFRAPDPQRAATIANAFMDIFIQTVIELKTADARRAADWFAPQLERASAQLAEARVRLEAFQSEMHLLSGNVNDTEADRLLGAANALSAARADLVALQSQLTTPGAGANDSSNPDVQTLVALRNALATAEAEIARLGAQVGANHPARLEKEAARNSLRGQIKAAEDSYRLKLADRVAAQAVRVARLEKAYGENVQDMVGVQGRRERLAQLRAQAQFQQEELERLQRAATQARLQS